MSTPPDTSSLRCGDDDRQLVFDVLDAAYCEGRITSDEHVERLDQARQARTFAELAAITDDLAPLQQAGSTYETPAHQAVVDTSSATGEIDRFVAILGDVKRTGMWRLRARSTGFVALGDVKLDLRTAVLVAHECVIDLPVLMGDLKIWLPEGVQVRDETVSVLGSVKLLGLTPTSPDAPVIVLKGIVALGDVKVYGPAHVGLGQRLGLKP